MSRFFSTFAFGPHSMPFVLATVPSYRVFRGLGFRAMGLVMFVLSTFSRCVHQLAARIGRLAFPIAAER